MIGQHSLLSADDLYMFNEGTHYRLYNKLGSHLCRLGGVIGAYFAVWAPNAEYVSVVGEFNGWDRNSAPLAQQGHSGIWEGFLPGVTRGTLYKYHIESRYHRYRVDKADPFANATEMPPGTASAVWELTYAWNDSEWMATRGRKQTLDSPFSIYEVHLGSWRRISEEHDRPLSYKELAEQLVPYIKEMGFTHVELLPIMEHPFYGSWGYQTTSYFAPTRRYGEPQDLMWLIDCLHQSDIGVILDWVPSHFPMDGHSLGYFDGTHLYEHSDPRQGVHRDWDTLVFNYGRNEVCSFLISSALFWLDKYHADALRVDAVASMLYLDYSRKPGEWIPNKFGGRENLEAIRFLRTMNEQIYKNYPDVQTIAEESTAWPMVSKPAHVGGLGFGLKWDMGWMHDTLAYLSRDPIYRRFHHDQLTFRALYAFTENYVLPLSHDEVVHGKSSLLGKMPGDDWRKFANLRLLLAYMYALPGKKLLFMGGEFGQRAEWGHDRSLDWPLLQYAPHQGVRKLAADLTHLYRSEPALHKLDNQPAGFEWIDCHDADACVLSCMRKAAEPKSHTILIVCNFTPVPRHGYRVGAPYPGVWREILNSDSEIYGGSGQGNFGGQETTRVAAHGRPQSLTLTLPPLAAIYLCHET
ncbi:MAG: 1,4-alpha-glucan branching protein GlgB [Acidobacteriota bacterium]